MYGTRAESMALSEVLWGKPGPVLCRERFINVREGDLACGKFSHKHIPTLGLFSGGFISLHSIPHSAETAGQTHVLFT